MKFFKHSLRATFFLLAALLSLSLAGLSEAHMINIDPGNYTGQYQAGGSWHTGSATIDLPTGSHRVTIGIGGIVDIEVDVTGNMMSLKPTSATSSGNTLTFLTSPVVINPGAYLGRWNVRNATGWLSGVQPLNLVPDQTYWVGPSIAGTIPFKIDTIGNISSLKTTSATSSGSTLTFLTSPVTINPGLYLGQWYIAIASTRGYGIQTLDLVVDQNYHVGPGVAGNIHIKVDATGNIVSLKPTSATSLGSTLTFLTSPVTINPGLYLGQWSLGGASAWDSGIQTLNLVPDQHYIVLPGHFGYIHIKVDAIGNVSSYKPTSATGLGSTLTFLTSSITIDPGTYLGTWKLFLATGQTSGIQTLDLVIDQRYQMFTIGVSYGLFTASPPCAIDFPELTVDGITMNISCGTPNRPPVALATVDPQIACAGASCPIILDGSGSTDPDSPAGTNLDIALFEWFANYGTANQSYLGAGEVTSTALALGSHSLTLVVTDSEGAIDTDTVTVVIDPAKLSLLKLKKVEIDWPKASETLAEVKMKGYVALPVGVSFADLMATGDVSLDLSNVPNILSQTVNFQKKSPNKWEYKANPAASGIKKFKIHWKGGEYEYKGIVGLETEFIGVTETTISLDRQGTNVPVTMNINGVYASVDEFGNVVTSAPFETDEDGEVTFTLPFELTPTMIIELSVGTEPTKTLKVADHYTPGIGKFKMKAFLNPGTLNGNSRPADLMMHLSLGAEHFSGSLGITEFEWSKLSAKEWKAKLKK